MAIDRSVARPTKDIQMSRDNKPHGDTVAKSAPPGFARTIALVMIGIAVIASYFLTPVPIAVGMTILAALRLWILWREERKCRDIEPAGAVPTDPVCDKRYRNCGGTT